MQSPDPFPILPMRYDDNDSTLDDARDEERGYRQWQRKQYATTPREYWDVLDTSVKAFIVDTSDDDTLSLSQDQDA
jgi:hypothetical protein